MINFLWPEALAFLALVALVAALYARRLRRRAVRIAGLQIPVTTSWKQHTPAFLFMLAMVLAVLAAARPTALITLPSQQRTIMLTVDVSLSMRAADVQPSRIAAAQEAAREFIKDLPRDVRLGIVSFAGTAAVVQQPTTSKEDLLAAVDQEGLRADDFGIGRHRDGNAEAFFQCAQVAAFLVEHIERDFGAGAHDQIVGCALEQRFLDRAQQCQRD